MFNVLIQLTGLALLNSAIIQGTIVKDLKGMTSVITSLRIRTNPRNQLKICSATLVLVIRILLAKLGQ